MLVTCRDMVEDTARKLDAAHMVRYDMDTGNLFPTDLEPWVDEWDISVADELTWLSDPESFDGSKTLYLKRIMNQLVVSSNTVQTTGENALSPTHELVRFYVDLYVDEQGYFRTE